MGGVILAIVLQTIELRYQREELQESQATWKETTKAQQASVDTLKEQADNQLLAAYLNALSAAREALSNENLSQSEWELFFRVDDILPDLAYRVEQILERDIEYPTDQRWAAEVAERTCRDIEHEMRKVDIMIREMKLISPESYAEIALQGLEKAAIALNNVHKSTNCGNAAVLVGLRQLKDKISEMDQGQREIQSPSAAVKQAQCEKFVRVLENLHRLAEQFRDSCTPHRR